MLHRYPLGIRPFYTMPCKDDERYSCSFDIFIRGVEIISGAQVGPGGRADQGGGYGSCYGKCGRGHSPLACHANFALGLYLRR